MRLKYAIKPLEENKYILKNFIHERNLILLYERPASKLLCLQYYNLYTSDIPT